MLNALLYAGTIWLNVVTFYAVKDHSNSYCYLFWITVFVLWLISSLQDEFEKLTNNIPFATLRAFTSMISYVLIVAGWAANWAGPSHTIALVAIVINGLFSCLSALTALIRKL